MIIIDDLKFDIKQKTVFQKIASRETALESIIEFITENTTLDEVGANSLIVKLGREETVDFILKKLSIDTDDSFVSNVNNFIKKVDDDISYTIMLELMTKGYKGSELLNKSKVELFEILMLELTASMARGDNGFKIEMLKNVMNKKYKKENVESFLNLFNMNIEKAKEKDNGIDELINELNDL